MVADDLNFNKENLYILPYQETGNVFETGVSAGKQLVTELKKRRMRRCIILVRDDRKAAGIILLPGGKGKMFIDMHPYVFRQSIGNRTLGKC